MFALVLTIVLVAAVLAFLVRDLRRAGYGRPAVPSIADVGAERTKALRLAASSARD